MEDNLDRECFSFSMKIVEALTNIEDEKEREKEAKNLFNIITKSLGVLQEDGVFAFYVYLKSEKEKTIEKETINLLNKVFDKNMNCTLENIKEITNDINTLLFAKSLIEKTLIYARYQAKSMSD